MSRGFDFSGQSVLVASKVSMWPDQSRMLLDVLQVYLSGEYDGFG